MYDLNSFLGILVSISTIILIVVGIILGIRMIQIIDKANRVLDNVEEKVNSLNGFFSIIDKTTVGFDLITTRVVNTFTELFTKLFKRKKEENEENE